MRTSFSPITTLVAAFFTIAAISLTGCQSGFKMPTPSWLGFNKKPSTSSVASKPDTNYPSPSATVTPGRPQSYAQNRGTGSSYGARPGGSYYSKPSNGAGSTNPNYASGGASSARGFYSPDYAKRGASQTVSGGYGTPPTSYATNSAPVRGGSSREYGANGFAPASGARSTGQPWASNDRGSQYGAAPRSTVSDYDYGRTAARNATPDYGSYRSSGTASDYPRDSAPYGVPPTNFSNSKNAPPYSGSLSAGARSTSPADVRSTTAGEFRPGSTGRSTQYGDSQNINVAGLRDVQRASYGADNRTSDARSVTDGSQAAPANHGSQGSQVGTRQYPSTNSSIYR